MKNMESKITLELVREEELGEFKRKTQEAFGEAAAEKFGQQDEIMK